MPRPRRGHRRPCEQIVPPARHANRFPNWRHAVPCDASNLARLTQPYSLFRAYSAGVENTTHIETITKTVITSIRPCACALRIGSKTPQKPVFHAITSHTIENMGPRTPSEGP